MNRDWIIRLIRQEFLDKNWCKSPNDYYMKKSWFAQRSYEQWATKEILSYMKSRKDSNPLGCVQEFKFKMNNYACKNPETSYIFSVAYDRAEQIEDFIVVLMMKEDKYNDA